MTLNKLDSDYTRKHSIPESLEEINNKLNDTIDVVNDATDGSETMATLTATTEVITDTVTEYTATAGVTVDGLLIKDGALQPTLGTVTQITSFSTAVTLNTKFGTITTVAATLAGDGALTGFTFNNTEINEDSIVMLSLEYAGNGTPVIYSQAIFAGQISIRVRNAHPTEALSTVLKISFQVIS